MSSASIQQFPLPSEGRAMANPPPILPPQEHGNINFGQAPVPLTVNYAPRRVLMYYASESELNELAKSGNSLNWIFFGLCAGGLLSFASVLLSTDITNPKMYATFIAVTIVLSIGTLFFGVNGFRDYGEIQRTLARLKSTETRS